MKMMNATASASVQPNLDLDARILSEQELEDAAGGLVGIVGLGLAAFAIGYAIGKDIAER